MRKRAFFFFILLCALLQPTLLDAFRIFGVKPDLLLLSVVVASINFKLRSALFFSILSGILKDAFSVHSFGLNTLLFPLWTLALFFLAKEVQLDDDYIRIGLVLVVALLHNLTQGFMIVYFGGVVPFGIFLRLTFLGVVYTTAVFCLLLRYVFPLLSLNQSR